MPGFEVIPYNDLGALQVGHCVCCEARSCVTGSWRAPAALTKGVLQQVPLETSAHDGERAASYRARRYCSPACYRHY